MTMDLLLFPILPTGVGIAICGVAVWSIWFCYIKAAAPRDIDDGPIPGGGAPPSSPIEAPVMGQGQFSLIERVRFRLEPHRSRTDNPLGPPADNLEGQPVPVPEHIRGNRETDSRGNRLRLEAEANGRERHAPPLFHPEAEANGDHAEAADGESPPNVDFEPF